MLAILQLPTMSALVRPSLIACVSSPGPRGVLVDLLCRDPPAARGLGSVGRQEFEQIAVEVVEIDRRGRRAVVRKARHRAFDDLDAALGQAGFGGLDRAVPAK